MGNTLIASAYDGPQLTISELMKDPTFIPQRAINELEGMFLEELLFRNGGTNNGTIAYREAASPYLDMDAQEVAEFAEIPVAHLHIGELKSITAIKTALAIRISREMIRENRIDQLSQHLMALQKTMIRTSVNASMQVFKTNTHVQTMAAGNKWDQKSDPSKDLFDAIEKVQGATNDEGQLFDYEPDMLIGHPTAITKLFRNEKIQNTYIGDVAHDNPIYKGVKDFEIAGLQVATSRYMNPKEVFVLESGTAGFYSDTDPLQATPFYEEGGNSGAGGPRQTYRADMWRKRVVALDNPKAVCKITGITA